MSNFLAKAQKEIVKNAPTILTVMGAIGTLASVALSSDSALKAQKALGKAGNDISKADKALIYAEAYAPTAIMTTASLVCIFGSNHINKQRIASLAGAYILSETAFKEYRDKAEELVGKKKVQQIKDEIIQDHISTNPPTPENTYMPYAGNSGQTLSLWYDDLTGRYFYSSAERIRKAELEATRMLQKNGYVSINDIYELLNLPTVKIGDDNGWMSDWCTEVNLDIEGGLTDVDMPCGVLVMDPRPSSAWLSEV